ncbi:hypothetical protein D3C83_60910 [compost metagenome]
MTSGSAGAPFEVENFRPLYSGGLCEAVKLMAPMALRRMVSNETHGVGTSRVQRKAWMPLKARILAASEANFSERNRVSYATMTPDPCCLLFLR